MALKEKSVTFPAKIVITKKDHWYITIPPSAKKLIHKEENKIVKVTLEGIL